MSHTPSAALRASVHGTLFRFMAATIFASTGPSLVCVGSAPVLRDFDFWRGNVGIAYRW
jgi:hypothetical protein